MMRNFILFTFMVLGVGFSACTSSVELRENAPPYAYNGETYAQVELTVNKDATEDLEDIVRFDEEELRKMIERSLKVQGLIDSSSTKNVKIEITDVRVRSTFNAFMWGFMAGNDHIHGDVSLIDENGKPFHTFNVSAAYALGGFMGFKETRMGWLYEEFTELTLKEITGKEVDEQKSEDSE